MVAYYKTVCAEIKHKGNKRCDMREEETGERSLKTQKYKINKAKRGNMKRKRIQINSEMGAEGRKDNERKSAKNEGGENWVKRRKLGNISDTYERLEHFYDLAFLEFCSRDFFKIYFT
jgi:hypothetical protein